jgi:hypothetical protein
MVVVIPAHGSLRQEDHKDCKFKASLAYKARPYLLKKWVFVLLPFIPSSTLTFLCRSRFLMCIIFFLSDKKNF